MQLNTVKLLQAILSQGTADEQALVDIRIAYQSNTSFTIHSINVSDGYKADPANAAAVASLQNDTFQVLGVGKVYNITDGLNTIFDILKAANSDVDDLYLDGVSYFDTPVGVVTIGGTVNVPVASWDTTHDDGGYDYVIASDSGMDTVVASGHVAASDTPSLTLTGLSLADGDYFITVANTDSDSTPSEAVTFTIAVPTVTLGSVTLHSGNADYAFTTANRTATNSLQLQWNNSGTWTNFGAASSNVGASGTKSAISNPQTGATSVRARLVVNGVTYTSNTIAPVLTA